MALEKGLVQIYDGDGKGKTTAAFGLAMRAVGRGLRVHVIQFLKCSNRYGELKAAGSFSPLLTITQTGAPCRSDDGSPGFVCTGCMKCHVDPASPSEADLEWARRGLELAREKSLDGSCDILILDELNYAVSFGLLEAREAAGLVSQRRPNVEILVTGRGTPRELLDMADLVTTMKQVKHHYEEGVSQVKGIDY
jgi:cob(I)alamin adenosyltransferase